jgi:hypothetical protein
MIQKHLSAIYGGAQLQSLPRHYTMAVFAVHTAFAVHTLGDFLVERGDSLD